MTELGTGYQCLRRGISIMRLALGYAEPLPDGFEIHDGGIHSKWQLIDEIRALLMSFPKHHVRIICPDHQAEVWELKRSEYHTGPRANVGKFENSHVLAISYMHNRFGECHFLIGSPVQDMLPLIRYTISVSMKEKIWSQDS